MSMRQLKITQSITNRESPSLEKYLQEINKLDLVPAEQEALLADRIKQGDRQALDVLVKANLRFVVSVAKQYQYRGLSLPDLVNEGNIGLMRAAESFDHTKGFRFISYAVWWIRQQILVAIAENSRPVRMPVNRLSLRAKLQKTSNQMEQQLERMPTLEELAEELQIDIEEIRATMAVNDHSISLDTPLSEDSDETMLDTLVNSNAAYADEKVAHDHSLRIELERSLKSLEKRQITTLCWYFGIGCDRPQTLEDIAAKMNLTRERVRQIKDKALAKLRVNGNAQVLRSFLSA